MDRIDLSGPQDQIGPNRPNWTEQTQVDRIDQIGPTLLYDAKLPNSILTLYFRLLLIVEEAQILQRANLTSTQDLKQGPTVKLGQKPLTSFNIICFQRFDLTFIHGSLMLSDFSAVIHCLYNLVQLYLMLCLEAWSQMLLF